MFPSSSLDNGNHANTHSLLPRLPPTDYVLFGKTNVPGKLRVTGLRKLEV